MKKKLILRKKEGWGVNDYDLCNLNGSAFLLDLCPRLVHKFLGIRLKPGEECKIELNIKAKRIK